MNDVEPLSSPELERVLPHLLAPAGGVSAVTSAQIEGFHEYLTVGGASWEGFRVGPAAAPRAAFLALLLPGRTAIVLIAAPGVEGIDAEAQRAITAAGLEHLRSRGLHYAQALLEPGSDARRAVLACAGFSRLAPLVYLERMPRYPWVDPPDASGCAWRSYDAASRSQFEETVLATYEGSLDCPELTGLRPIGDILAAHRASGRWDPSLWELALVDGEPAGCLLLATLAGGVLLEIVYTGVVPVHRGRGIGKLLLRRALEQARRVGVGQVSVVVDGRNEPAKRLYERFMFRPVTRREALVYRWPETS